MGDVFKALADPTRRMILDELADRRGQTLFEICARLTTKHGIGSSRQAISQHLDVLEGAGLVHTRRDGRYKFHDIDTRPLQPIVDRWVKAEIADDGACHGTVSTPEKGNSMRINLASVLVDEQDKALRFYTEVLGFQQKHDVPMGDHRWITVVSPEDPNGTQLVLEPDEHPSIKPFKAALVADGIPFTAFTVDDVRTEFQRLHALGVKFTQEPTGMGPVTTAVLDDTCGNLIQIQDNV